MNRSVYAVPGTGAQQIGGTPEPGAIEMQGARPGPHHIAQPDGTWAVMLKDSKARKRAEINAAYAAELSAILADYPEAERLSWDKQEREARAFAADNTAPTPFLDGIAAARGLALSELVGRVIAKADAWADASSTATGKRQALEDAIAAAATVADVEAIAW